MLWDLVEVEGKYYLVVMGAPKEHVQLYQQSDSHVNTYPYKFRIL
jgi:hypothetical protein